MVMSAMLSYGSCPCGGYYEQRYVEVRLVVDGRSIVLAAVPQGACPSCGSRVYKAEILERIEAVMKNEPHERRLLGAEP